jgi:hypothetical protein
LNKGVYQRLSLGGQNDHLIILFENIPRGEITLQGGILGLKNGLFCMEFIIKIHLVLFWRI